MLVVVHGGAWEIPEALHERSVAGVASAATAAAAVLQGGGSAVDAVEAAVRVMEDDPVFDCGVGSCLTRDGRIEMDALLMSGADLGLGCVCGVSTVANPVSLARAVLERSPHVLFAAGGADRFAREQGIPEVDPESLITPMMRAANEKYATFGDAISDLVGHGHDTVGCVAIDADGHLAVATSTGGLPAKQPGRVGDSPLVGCGGYADDLLGAVSTTGHGESIARVMLARAVLAQAEAGSDAQAATRAALRTMEERVGGQGGAITILPNGDFALEHTTRDMPWAVASVSPPSSAPPDPCVSVESGIRRPSSQI